MFRFKAEVTFRNIQRMLPCFLVGALCLGATTSEDLASFNLDFKELLHGQTLKVEEVQVGMKIPLNSIVSTMTGPYQPNAESLVTISFRRRDVDPLYLSSLFDKRNAHGGLPLNQRGIEVVLSHEQLKITVHKGVILHLRNDLPGLPGYKTFVAENVLGQVTEARGHAILSTDREIIRQKLSTVWTRYEVRGIQCIMGQNCFMKPDGSVQMEMIVDEKTLPQFYEPRLED